MIIPYMAMIIAHEDMNVYAYISIAEVILKLSVVFLLPIIYIDKLQLYGILLCIVKFIIMLVYIVFCKIKYPECIFKFYWNKKLFKGISGYTGWTLIGVIAGLLRNQGISILLNQFFNPMVVSARSITLSVNSAIASFSANFSTAINPRIIKSYSAGQQEEMMSLVFSGAKCLYLLMYLFALPLGLEMPVILSLWVKNPPEYSALFIRLGLIEILVNTITYSVSSAIMATGKIKLFQSLVSGILLLNLPASWIVLHFNYPAYSVFIVAICLMVIAILVELLIAKYVITLSIKKFIKKVLLPVCSISLLSAFFPVVLHIFLVENNIRLILVLFTSTIAIGIFSYLIGLNKTEREIIKNIIKRKMCKTC
jgi:O-antigen/teichoic acid export membrane protein